MTHRSTASLVNDLRQNGRLVEYDRPIDPKLEIAEIQRRVYLSGGPAILFSNVIGCRFPMAGNLFGSLEQARFIFRKTIEGVRRAIELKIDPNQFFQKPFRYWRAPFTALAMRPKRVRSGRVLQNEIKLSELPQLKSWPDDGGAFVTLPQVYSENPAQPHPAQSNLGMYRVQLAGNDFEHDSEIGLHYQIHRGIGVHHKAALDRGDPFRVNVFVGGSPSMTLSAVMPLPEGLSELTFAGALAGHRIPMIRNSNGASIYGDADFCITGTILPNEKIEGPFGDHLGYYSLQHLFPCLKVEKVYHRNGAIWPFTVVGRPPQEDTTFGELIHDITGPIIPTVIPGVSEVNAVDASGVHPLLLAMGSERYVPYANKDRPQELLTQANAILGQGQMSLAKYLIITENDGNEKLSVNKIEDFFAHVLQRVNWERDLHFQTCTTIDTLDYSGSGFNEGSKLVIAARGGARCDLTTRIPDGLSLPGGCYNPTIPMPGVLAVSGPKCADGNRGVSEFCKSCIDNAGIRKFRLIVIVDDSDFTAKTLNNFLWVVFTRSNPAVDIDGVDSFQQNKHWGCRGPLVIDARIKLHHAPPLIEDSAVTKKIDAIAASNHPISKYL
jgi:4-hydroxy-3-polyprenylbenzoate decarboxylase